MLPMAVASLGPGNHAAAGAIGDKLVEDAVAGTAAHDVNHVHLTGRPALARLSIT